MNYRESWERRPMDGDRVVVIGAGLSGLAAAHRLVSRSAELGRPIDLTVLDAKDRVGGVIRTRRIEGFTIEEGPDSFFTKNPWAVDLCKELNLGDQLLETDAKHRRSFVVRGGRLVPTPEGWVLMTPTRIAPMLATPLLSPSGKLRMLLDLVLPRKTDDADESLASFVKRRLGREALERLIQPLVGGIYTADPAELSMKAAFPQYVEMERKYRSLLRAAWNSVQETRRVEKIASGARYGLFLSLLDGMETLPGTLAATLPRGSVLLDSAVRRVGRSDSTGRWRVELLNGPPIEASGVVLATESHASARLLDAFDSDLSLHLRSIPYASSIIVNVAYRRDQIQHPLDGFGAVVPAIENRSILAVSFSSVKFPNRAPAGTVLLRVFLGGATQPELFDLEDDAVRSVVLRELRELIGASGEPLLFEIGRHPRSMPQYTLGHLERVATIRLRAAKHPRLVLTGIGFDGVGITDCVRAAREAADRLLIALADPARPAAA